MDVPAPMAANCYTLDLALEYDLACFCTVGNTALSVCMLDAGDNVDYKGIYKGYLQQLWVFYFQSLFAGCHFEWVVVVLAIFFSQWAVCICFQCRGIASVPVVGATSSSTQSASTPTWVVAVRWSAARDWAPGGSGHADMHGREPGPSRLRGATSSSSTSSSSVSSSSGCMSSWWIVYILYMR